MAYNFKFISGNRLVAIGVPGILLSFLAPVYLKVNFALNDALMFGLMASMLVIICLIAYTTSKRSEHFLVTDDGLHTGKHGLVKWNEVQGVKIVNSHEHEVLTIRFQQKEKISIPSEIIGNPNRQTFIDFRQDLEKRLSETNGAKDAAIQHSYAYGGKGYRVLGYILLLALFLFTPYVLYLVIMGEMTAEKSVSVIVFYGSVLPGLVTIFRDEIFGKTK